MGDIYHQIPIDNARIGDYVEYKYVKKSLGFITNRRYSSILCQDLIMCTNYQYEIDINDVIVFRYVKSD